MSGEEEVGLYVFAYGSLIWKPSIPFVTKEVGYIRDFKRRFWMGSTDHRGVPGAPGRVITLLDQKSFASFGDKADTYPDETNDVWGVAYGVPASETMNVLDKLDYREKCGYERVSCDVYLKSDESNVSPRVLRDVVVFVATPSAEEFLGPAPMPDLAKHIAGSEGPSGRNDEYVYNLAEGLRALNIHDPHIFALEKELRALEQQKDQSK